MNYNDEFDDDYDDDFNGDDLDFDSPGPRDLSGEGKSKRDLDLLDITNPMSAYFFLSDDAQDELKAGGRKVIKCLSCGHGFVGETYDNCPRCFSSNTGEISNGIDHEIEIESKAKMKCLTCGHIFQGDIFNDCPECYSADTEQFILSIDDEDDYSV
jgi:Zn finger protein HypA/HybF involved in hydrogenase expression